jgi:hypothetical protein
VLATVPVTVLATVPVTVPATARWLRTNTA